MRMNNIIRLGDYITEICEKTTANNQHMVLTSSQEGIVSQDDYFNKQVASKDNTGYKVIRRGQFTYRAMSDTGRFYINRLCDYDTGIVSPAYPVFELKKNEDILPDYLQEYFHSEQFQNSIALSSTGSTRVSLKLSKIADLRIAVPSISDQRHMIIAIQHVSNLISVQNSALCKLDELVKSRFVEMFGENVPTVRLGSVCQMINGDRGKNYPSGEDFVPMGVPFVNAGHLQEGRVDFSSMNYITEEKYALLSQGKMRRNDILYCLRGSLGKHGLVDFERGAVASSLVILRCNEQRILPQFLFYAIETPEIEKQLKAANNGSSQPNLSAASVKAYNIKLPSINKQTEFAAFVAEVDKSKLAVKQSLEKLETLKKSLMQQYFG